MKTKSLFVAALFSAVATVSVIAKDEPANGMAVVSSKGSQIVRVIYKAGTAGRVKLSIIDSSSKVVFSESRTTTDGFILPLNFSALEYGTYTIQLTDATGTKSEKFVYEAPVGSAIHVSQLGTDGKFLLSVANAASNNVTVKIFDSASNLVHTSSQPVSGDFAQVYVIKNFDGACTFEVSSNDFVKTVRF